MLIQIEHGIHKINVYIEAKGYGLFSKLQREDIGYIRSEVFRLIKSLINKYDFMYSERGKKDVVA